MNFNIWLKHSTYFFGHEYLLANTSYFLTRITMAPHKKPIANNLANKRFYLCTSGTHHWTTKRVISKPSRASNNYFFTISSLVCSVLDPYLCNSAQFTFRARLYFMQILNKILTWSMIQMKMIQTYL